MSIQVKRAYDTPSSRDGTRILVDRLWPRGVKKEDARIDLWLKDLTPSPALRKWFHADPEHRFDEFKKRYKSELKKRTVTAGTFGRKKTITLVTAVKDIDHSHIPVLKQFVEHHLDGAA